REEATPDQRPREQRQTEALREGIGLVDQHFVDQLGVAEQDRLHEPVANARDRWMLARDAQQERDRIATKLHQISKTTVTCVDGNVRHAACSSWPRVATRVKMRAMPRIRHSRPNGTRKTAQRALAEPRKRPIQARSKHMVEMLMRATARILVRDGY